MKKSAHKGGELFIWDATGTSPVGDWTTVLWRGFGDDTTPETISIPRLVEIHAEELREQYLAWVYELGEMRIQGQRLIDRLKLRPGFSYWWMSLIVEKSYGKSDGVYEVIRMMAFEKWANSRSPGSVILASHSMRLAECMRSWCNRYGIAFEWQRMSYETKQLSLAKRLYQFLPLPFQALTWLVHHIFQYWPLRGAGLSEWRETKGRVTFVSYLCNLTPDAAKEGDGLSRYWAHLPNDLQNEGCKTNWLHLYVKDESLLTAGKAADAIRYLNKTKQGAQTHVALDSFLEVSTVFRTLFDWGRLVWSGRRLHNAIHSPQNTAFDLWPLFEEDWQQSMFGPTAMSNALFLNLFESALKSLPKQRVGVYLQENQGWEIALIHAWKAAGHDRLIGSPHSTVRYWDLRYFFDPRSYSRNGGNNLPLPDLVAFNGPAVFNAYQNGGYPIEGMVEVEALRYLLLGGAISKKDYASQPLNSFLRVLVLGDYFLNTMQKQMLMLEKAVQYLPQAVIIMVKPHPNCPIQPADYPALKMEMTMKPISKLLAGCDVAYTSSGTSAAVDAYYAGTPVVSLLDPNTLNLSPLRGREMVSFVSTPEELASALISAASSPRLASGQQDFFTLDPRLPRWRKLLLEPK